MQKLHSQNFLDNIEALRFQLQNRNNFRSGSQNLPIAAKIDFLANRKLLSNHQKSTFFHVIILTGEDGGEQPQLF